MIAYIQGQILDIQDETCTVLTPGGVGYLLFLPATLLRNLPQSGEEISLFVHTVVREDSIDLYGFGNKAQMEAFSQLIAVSKLGPKTALAILSTFDPDTLSGLVLREDYHSLTRVPGIGQKTAKRLIWELKDKFVQGKVRPGISKEGSDLNSGVYSDTLAALINLGYSEVEVVPVLEKVLQDDPDLMTGEAIRAVLKEMSKRK